MCVAVVTPNEYLAAWQSDALEQIGRLSNVDVSVVCLSAASGRQSKPPLFASVACHQQRVARPFVDLPESADVILDFADEAFEVTPRLGVWRFRLGTDDDQSLPFIREFLEGATVFNVVLERHSREGATVLRDGVLPASSWYASSVFKTLREAARWPAELLDMARNGVLLPDCGVASRHSNLRRTAPSWPSIAVVVLKRFLTGLLVESFDDHIWNVGIVHDEPRVLVRDAPLDVRWLGSQRSGAWIADPFVVERDGKRVIFVEEYDEADGRGMIAALTLGESDVIETHQRILELTTHASYPYPVEIDGTLFLVPENVDSRRVRMYRCVRFPDLWEPDAFVFENSNAVDTTIIEYGGLWWSFFTLADRGRDFSLHAAHAPSPTGPWTLHPCNPLVTDVSRARPAGQFFIVDGVLYRPGQDCSQTYGGGLSIARVDELSREAYRETVVRRFSPTSKVYPEGIHTVSFFSNGFVVDGKRKVRRVRLVVRRLGAILRRGVLALGRRVVRK